MGNSSFFGRIPVSRNKMMMLRNSGPQKGRSLCSAFFIEQQTATYFFREFNLRKFAISPHS